MKEKNQNLLEVLEKQPDPIGIMELSQLLDAPQRSVRRWLHEWIVAGAVIKSGSTRNAKYAAHRKNEHFLNFSDSSRAVLRRLDLPLYERQPVSYNEGWFDEYIPNESNYLPIEVRNRLGAAGMRLNSNEPAGTYAHEIYNRLLIDLSYNSSRLEGNTYSLLDTERLLLQGDVAEGKLDEEKIMILNHREAIRYIVNNASRLTVSLETVLTLHFLLADNRHGSNLVNSG